MQCVRVPPKFLGHNPYGGSSILVILNFDILLQNWNQNQNQKSRKARIKINTRSHEGAKIKITINQNHPKSNKIYNIESTQNLKSSSTNLQKRKQLKTVTTCSQEVCEEKQQKLSQCSYRLPTQYDEERTYCPTSHKAYLISLF